MFAPVEPMKRLSTPKPVDQRCFAWWSARFPSRGRARVRVRVQVSGVNPTDWKARRAGGGQVAFPEYVLVGTGRA